MRLYKLLIALFLFSPTLALATGNTTDVVTLFMLFLSIIAAVVQTTVVGILVSMRLFKYHWLVTVSFIISVLNLLFYLISLSYLGNFGQADLSVWIIIIVVLVASPALILMTFIMPTRQYKQMEESTDEK